MKLEIAQKILAGALRYAETQKLKPLAIAVLDARGALKSVAVQDGSSLKREEVALAKARGALALGVGSRALARRAAEHPHFIAAVTHAVGGALIPVPGGVLVKTGEGELVGVVGISGDTSDNDEAAAIAGIEAAQLVADPG
jgi:uncharacterized protein GlcG (DUF336 family)